MTNRIVLLVVLFLVFSLTKGEIISLSGVYEGINLYVENDSLHGKGCMKEIFVNDKSISFERDKHFFEIDMSFLKVKDQVTVKIICEPGCTAKILNPEAINLMYGFQFMNLKIQENKIEWYTTNEKPGGKFIIELNIEKQWVAIGEISGKGNSKLVNFYEKKQETVKHYYYRIKYVDKDGVPHSSHPIKLHKPH